MTHPYSWPEVRRGAERIAAETARCMADRGHKVTAFTAGDHSERRTENGVTTVKLRRLFSDRLRHERWFALSLVPYLLRGRFDAIHSMMPYDALAAVRTRRLAGHRSIYSEIGIPLKSWWSQIPDGKVRRDLVRRVDVFGCMSRFSLDALQHDWGRTGDLIPCGVRMSEFVPSGARHPRPTILFSGALTERHKGLGDLLVASDLLMDQHPDLQLWLSGPGNPNAMLAQASPRVRERVTLLPMGEPREQAQRYSDAWVTALPSVGDSFGMVLVESLACGTPIVVADDSAPPELVTDTNGAIAQPHDPPSLAKALAAGLHLARDPATRDHCRVFARQFDWDEVIAPLLERLYGEAR